MFWQLSFIGLILAICKVPASGLSNLRVSIPETIQRGKDVVFNCSFNLQDEKLYAIKWYRGTYEIFRFIPSEKPPIKTFPLEGFNVSEASSSGWSLHMQQVSFINSGAYSCEVIADTTFHTLIETKEMLVIDLPDEKPRITGVKESYQVGENIKASCTSWQSHPPANLTWFINGEPAKESYLRRYDLRREYDETFTTVLGLHFDVLPMHFRGNAMVLKCTSSLLSIYWQSSEVRIKQQVPHISPMINGQVQVPSSSRRGNTPTVLDKALPPSKKENMPVEQLTSHNYSGSGPTIQYGYTPMIFIQSVILIVVFECSHIL